MSIVIENLSVRYSNNSILENFTAQFAKGKVSVILGRSGCGKTTLLNCMAGIVPYSGSVSGVDSISYVFQQPRLIDNISVYDNLQLTTRHVILERATRHDAIVSALTIANMSDKCNRLCATLSGGEKQRVSIVRACMSNAPVLLLDEPMQGLDIVAKQRLTDMIIQLIGGSERSVVYVTHDLHECLAIADDIYVMQGTPASIVHVASIDDAVVGRDIACGYEQIKRRMIELLIQ